MTNRDVIFLTNFLLDLTTAFQSDATHHEVQDKITPVYSAQSGIRKLSTVGGFKCNTFKQVAFGTKLTQFALRNTSTNRFHSTDEL